MFICQVQQRYEKAHNISAALRCWMTARMEGGGGKKRKKKPCNLVSPACLWYLLPIGAHLGEFVNRSLSKYELKMAASKQNGCLPVQFHAWGPWEIFIRHVMIDVTTQFCVERWNWCRRQNVFFFFNFSGLLREFLSGHLWTQNQNIFNACKDVGFFFFFF